MQRVNEGAIAQRLPGAWHSPDIFSGLWSGDGVQLALGVARQVRALGPVLAQQAIRILVGSALPRAVGIGKEDLDREPLGPRLVLGPLFASIIRPGVPQQDGHMADFW